MGANPRGVGKHVLYRSQGSQDKRPSPFGDNHIKGWSKKGQNVVPCS